MQEVFQGPAEYAGMPASDDSISNIGHLNIWSSPIRKIDDAGLGVRATSGLLERQRLLVRQLSGSSAQRAEFPLRTADT
jgi:hypothetical protein